MESEFVINRAVDAASCGETYLPQEANTVFKAINAPSGIADRVVSKVVEPTVGIVVGYPRLT